ncbi:MAG TPA: Ig-like domain-containing protein [Chitinophagaceae bacterium]
MKKALLFLLLSCLIFTASEAQTCGSINLALGRPVTGPASYSYESASLLVDGNTNWHFWPTQRDSDQTATIQLAAPTTICRVVVKWDQYHYGNFKIQVTNTDPSGGGTVTWTDVAVVSSNNSPAVDSNVAINDLSIPNSYGANQWVRFYMIGPLLNNMPEEVEVYGLTGNQLPTVSLTAPTYNAQFAEGNTITLAATAADADGSVHKVEFYQGDTWLGEDSTAPYTLTWSNVATGNYQLYAVAYDNLGATTETGYTNIVVNPGSGWSLKGNAGIRPDSQFLGTIDNSPLIFRTGNTERARIDSTGTLLINTTSLQGADSTTRLAVKGSILAKNLRITQLNWADYVFGDDYKLMPLRKVGKYIDENKHLPGIPTTATITHEGLDVGKGQTMLLQKIEELTLYLLEQDKKLERQQKEINSFKKKLAQKKSN